MKSLRQKLLFTISIFVLALTLLIIGVWAVGETKHINLNGNVDFTISDNNLYIKDIRIRDAGSSEQGTTIDNFIPGFVKSSFELNLGSFDVDSDFDLIIDVVNTTTTIYEVDTSFDISNGTVIASGRIEGDGVPLTEVATADISGQIILNVTITSAGIVDLDQVDIPLTEYIPQVYDYFTFEVNEDGQTVSLTAFEESLADSADISIPATVDLVDGVWQEGTTYTVTAIAGATSSTSGVFYNSGITSITFPETLESIGNYAFHLSGLTRLTLPYSLTSIGERAFVSCSAALLSITVDGATSESVYYSEGNCLIERATSTIVLGCKNSTIPSDVINIGNYAFYGGLIGELDLSNCAKLEVIGDWAFAYGIFTSIVLPSNLTSIGDNSFVGYSTLTSLDLSSCTKLETIGDSAFDSCSGLTRIDFSNCTSLTRIGRYAFQRCSALESVIFPNTTGWFVATYASAIIGTSVDVTDSSLNADNFIGKYSTYYWKRNA